VLDQGCLGEKAGGIDLGWRRSARQEPRYWCEGICHGETLAAAVAWAHRRLARAG